MGNTRTVGYKILSQEILAKLNFWEKFLKFFVTFYLANIDIFDILSQYNISLDNHNIVTGK